MANAGDLDNDDGVMMHSSMSDMDMEELHLSMSAMDSFDPLMFGEGCVKDRHAMHELIREYTAAEIGRAADFIDGMLPDDAEDNEDRIAMGGAFDTHYEKLSALWGGDPFTTLFSPMDALLACERLPKGCDDNDVAVASVISGLPDDGVDWGVAEDGHSPMWHAVRVHGARTIEALLHRDQFFSDTECALAVRMMVCDIPSAYRMQRALRVFMKPEWDLAAWAHTFVEFAEDRGSALHVCCAMVPPDALFDKMTALLKNDASMPYGFDASRMTAVGGLRAADLLMIRANRATPVDQAVFLKCAQCLSGEPGGRPLKHLVREVDKLMARNGVPAEIAKCVTRRAYDV